MLRSSDPSTPDAPRGAEPLISGVVLAAGCARRMGTAKALLELEGQTFLARAIGALRAGGCGEVVVVTGRPGRPEMERIARLALREGARVAVNPCERSEQIDSLRVGLLATSPRAAAAVVTPVDLPRLEARVVRRLIEAFGRRRTPIVLPVHRGRRGHPALFSRAVFPELWRADLAEGARSVVHAHALDLTEVEVEDAGLLADVDTPADYSRLLGGGG